MVWAPRELGGALAALGRDESAAAIDGAWLFFGLSLAAGVFTYAMRRLVVGTSRRVERDLKGQIFGHLERLPASFFATTRTGDLLSRLTSDVEAVRFSLGPGFMYVGSTLVLFPAALASMFDLSPGLALGALVPLLVIAFVVRAMGPGIMRGTRAVQDRLGDLSARAHENAAGARVVRAYAKEPVEEGLFDAASRSLLEETLALARRRAWLSSWLYLLGGAAELVVVVQGGLLVMSGELDPGYLVTFLAYVGMLLWPMISVGWVVSAFQRSAAAMARIDEVLDQAPEASVQGETAPSEAPPRGSLSIRRLTFSYPGAARPALVDVSLEVPAGGTLGLVGPVGSGKSTLLRLLTRLHEPPPGTIFLDGVDVVRIPLERLRAVFACVPQDPFLFSDTLRANLQYAREEPLGETAERAAVEASGLDADCEDLPQGMLTVVGERGLMLSGGQKQRATLARALLREAPVLLLDDALSSVDTQTEERILARLEGRLRRLTAVVVAHRLSTVRHADRIVVLSEGRVLESGSSEELLRAGGWYARTHARQRLEAALEDAS
jgi:ATP-binding cassette subfamily B protein